MKAVWSRAFSYALGIALFVYLPVRFAVDAHAALWTVFVLVLGFLAWHLHQLARLIRWLRGPLDAPLPESRGLWDVVFAGLHRRVRIRIGQQQVLTETLESFNRAAQALPDGIIAFNKHRQIIWINTRAEGHFQLSANTDSGQALTNLIRHPEFVAYLEAGRYEEPLIYRSDRREGQTLLIQVIPYGNEQNLLLSRDISQLERLETMRRDFIANVSHELKTPLTVVAGFTEMLADDFAAYDPGEIKHYLSLICDQSARMQRLIDDLLTLSALETGTGAHTEERVEPEKLLRTIHAEAEALSGGRHVITLTIESPACLSGCSNELRSAFGNLASNAVSYTPEGGRIELGWRVRDGFGEFSVRDSGIGIAAQHLPRLTERFYRVDRSRSRETGGTGLGLAIVKHVLTRHQATLEIQSQPGKGSTFTARFPPQRILG